MASLRPHFFTFNLWFSYTISIAASLFFVVFAVPDCLTDIKTGVDSLYYLFFSGLVVAMTGAILSLFKQKIGAITMLTGGLAMVVWHVLKTPPLVALAIVYGFPYLISGFFLLLPKRG